MIYHLILKLPDRYEKCALIFQVNTANPSYRKAFLRDARILSALEDSHLSRVVALCSLEEPLGVVMEYLEHGDLHSFLRQHKHEDEEGVSGSSVR